MRRLAHTAWRVVQALLTAAVVLALLAVVVVPRVMGWVPLTVLSGSMEPEIPAGSQVVVVPVDAVEDVAEIQLGEVVTFMPRPDDPTLVTHRVVARTFSSDGTVRLTTQGDANDAPDEPVAAVQVRGVVRYHVPYVGYAANLLSTQQKSVGVTVVGVGLLAFAAVQLVRSFRARTATAPAAPPAAGPRAPEPAPDTRRARRLAAARGAGS